LHPRLSDPGEETFPEKCNDSETVCLRFDKNQRLLIDISRN
jgi:hypothetical protein